MHVLLVTLQLSWRRKLSVTEPAALPLITSSSSSSQLRVLKHVLHQPAHKHTQVSIQFCTCVQTVNVCSGTQVVPPQVVLSEVGADLTGEGGGFDSQWLWLSETQVAFKRPVVELLYTHHHPGGVGGQC